MPTIDATTGGATANSYVTEAEATTYFDERVNATAWTEDADPADRLRALISATRRLDQEQFHGAKATVAQALEWPRVDVYDAEGNEYEDVPTLVKHATLELAFALLSEDLLSNTGLEGFEQVEVGPLSVRPRAARPAGQLPENVKRILRPVLASFGATGRTWLS